MHNILHKFDNTQRDGLSQIQDISSGTGSLELATNVRYVANDSNKREFQKGVLSFGLDYCPSLEAQIKKRQGIFADLSSVPV